MSKRFAALLLALVLVLTCTGVALAQDTTAPASSTAGTGTTLQGQPGHKSLLPDMTNYTDEQKAAVQARLDTLKSIQEQISALMKANARDRFQDAIAQIAQAPTKDYGSLMPALDKAIAEAQTTLDAAQSGQPSTRPQ